MCGGRVRLKMKGFRGRYDKIPGLVAAALCASFAPLSAFRLPASSPCAGFSPPVAARSPGARSRQFAPRCGLLAIPSPSIAVSASLVAAARTVAVPIQPPPPAWLAFGRWQLLLGQELVGAAGDSQPLLTAKGPTLHSTPTISVQAHACGALHACGLLPILCSRRAAQWCCASFSIARVCIRFSSSRGKTCG